MLLHLLAKYHALTDKERLENYFWKLESLIPDPPEDWAKAIKPCKYLKIIKEKNKFAK